MSSKGITVTAPRMSRVLPIVVDGRVVSIGPCQIRDDTGGCFGQVSCFQRLKCYILDDVPLSRAVLRLETGVCVFLLYDRLESSKQFRQLLHHCVDQQLVVLESQYFG